LQESVEYCLVLLSDSNNYRVWIAQLGERNIGTDRFISEQPYAGVLFKSQNASTWTANQEQDLKFTIYAAEFDINAEPVIKFVNEPIPPIVLESDPFQTKSGSSLVRVFAPNHAMPATSSVIIANVANGTYNGIITTESTGLNGSFPIISSERDSFIIDVGSNATKSGFIGGTDVVATINVAYDAVNLITTSQAFNDTTLSFSVDTTNETYTSAGDSISLVPNITNYMDTPRLVASQENELSAMSNNKSLTVNVNMTSDNKNISPVIDTSRLSLITIKNKVDNYTYSSKNVDPFDFLTVLSGTVSFSGNVISVPDTTDLRASARSIAVGKYIQVDNTTSGTNDTVEAILVTAVAEDGSTITVDHAFTTQSNTHADLILLNNFVSEIAPTGSSSESKYVTRLINLEEASSFLKIMFAANVPAVTGSDIQVWYKLLPTGSSADISKFNYVQATNPVKEITKTSNPNTFYDIEFDLDNLPQYDALVVKLVFKSGNSAKVPRVKDLRIIACA
jgi:hypothetical protein